MRKQILSLLLLAALLLSGCGKPETAPQETAFSFLRFLLPEDFRISSETEQECTLLCVGQRVGGALKTDLSADVLVNPDFDAIRNYLSRFVPDGLVFDSMIDSGSTVQADFVLVDPVTRKNREFQHTFYEKDGCCFDLWLDCTYLSGWERAEILAASGIVPNLQYTMPEDTYVPNFENTGLNLGQPQGNTCPIVSEGAVIGGFDYTELSAEILHQEDDHLNMEDFDPTGSFVQMSYSEFCIRRYMQRHIPAGWLEEYILMYLHEDSEDPSVSMHFKITNPETSEERQSLHHFLTWDGQVYDSWNVIPETE